MFSTIRQNDRENCNLFLLFEQRVNVVGITNHDFFMEGELSYVDFSKQFIIL